MISLTIDFIFNVIPTSVITNRATSTVVVTLFILYQIILQFTKTRGADNHLAHIKNPVDAGFQEALNVELEYQLLLNKQQKLNSDEQPEINEVNVYLNEPDPMGINDKLLREIEYIIKNND